jgi:hypothetical protein
MKRALAFTPHQGIYTNMDNVTAAHGEELPHHLLEAIHKLLRAGASREAISMTLGLKLEVVQLVLAKDSSQMTHDASY